MLGLDFSHYPGGLLLCPTREKSIKKGVNRKAAHPF